jgi:uncharacterized protein
MQGSEQRHITLDALRGFAVMGILAMNIAAFSMPFMAYFNPNIYGGASGADLFSWFFGFILIDGKMRGLFSLLFGASMMLIISRAEANGENPVKVHYARMFWLALFGLFHFYFIWLGDILFLYAIMGCLAFAFRKWEAGRLLKWGLIFYVIGAIGYALLMSGMLFLQQAATAPGASAEAVQQYREMMEPFSAAAAQEEMARYRSSYSAIVTHKLTEQRWEPFAFLLQAFVETLPLMMIGMALLKNGFVTGSAEPAQYRRWARGGIVIGGLGTALIAWVQYQSGFNPLIVFNAQVAWNAVPRLLMTLGYCAALLLIIRHIANSGFVARVAAAGQAAFTNYLGTSIVMTTIFYGYGLGLYGHVNRASLWLFVIGAWAVMLLWSKPWLTRYRYGPLEWLWRSLARMKIQPLRR